MTSKQAHCAGSCQSIPTTTFFCSSKWHHLLIFFLLLCWLSHSCCPSRVFQCFCAFASHKARISALCIVFVDDVVSVLLACFWCCLVSFCSHFLARISSSALLRAESVMHSKELQPQLFSFFFFCHFVTTQNTRASCHDIHGRN